MKKGMMKGSYFLIDPIFIIIIIIVFDNWRNFIFVSERKKYKKKQISKAHRFFSPKKEFCPFSLYIDPIFIYTFFLLILFCFMELFTFGLNEQCLFILSVFERSFVKSKALMFLDTIFKQLYLKTVFGWKQWCRLIHIAKPTLRKKGFVVVVGCFRSLNKI